MLESGDALSRDEMIIGPLSASSDRGTDAITAMATLVEQVRESPRTIQNALENVSQARNTQINTLKNYTRWPIAIMRDCGWTKKVRLKFRKTNQSFEAHKLTKLGKAVAERIAASVDIRIDQIDALSFEQKEGISVHTHYGMLGRAGFDLKPVKHKLDETMGAFHSALNSLGIDNNKDLLFSPFQSLSIIDTEKIFTASIEDPGAQQPQFVATGKVEGRDSREHLFVEPKFVHQRDLKNNGETEALKDELQAFYATHKSLKKAAQAFDLSRSSDTQVQFYPLISQMIRILGYKSEYSRAGVNYQRWDACVWVNEIAVPIEIKSPTEETFLSTKAIRQALENKIILLARESLATNREMTSLIIGYQVPNERGDMSFLIDDIYRAFDIRIGVIDLYTLALLAMRAITDEVTIDGLQLSQLRGFLHV